MVTMACRIESFGVVGLAASAARVSSTQSAECRVLPCRYHPSQPYRPVPASWDIYRLPSPIVGLLLDPVEPACL